MVRTGIPYDVWLRQPEGVIETALTLINEAEDGDGDTSSGKTVYSG